MRKKNNKKSKKQKWRMTAHKADKINRNQSNRLNNRAQQV